MSIRPLTTTSTPPTRAASYTAPMQQEIERLQGMRDLFKLTNNSGRMKEIDGIIAMRRQQMKAMENGPRQFSADEMAALRTAIEGPGAPTLQGVPADLVDSVRHMRSLVDNGMQFCDARLEDMKPVDAFVRITESPWQPQEQQVMFKTWDSKFISASTLRRETLPALDHYLDRSRQGIVFYHEKNGAMVRIDSPHDFIQSYGDAPASARVKAMDGSFLSEADARQREIDLAKKLLQINNGPGPDAPKVEDLGDTISIGGVVIRKRR